MASEAHKYDDPRIPADIAYKLGDPGVYADDHELHRTYAWLRANNPLGLAELEGYDPFWVVTKHADVMEVSRQNALFCSGSRQVILTTRAAEQRMRDINNGDSNIIYSLVSMDPPDHPKYRALTQSWFLPNNLRQIEGRVRTIARSAVGKMLATGGRCDFVADLAMGYPLHVIMDILGVPPEDEPRMLMLTQQIFGPQDPDTARDVEAAAANDPAAWADQLRAITDDYNDYFRRLGEKRRKTPRDDIATIIATAKVDGEPLEDHVAMGYYIILATAGHDTTSSSSAGAIWALAEDPAEFAKLKADPGLIPSLVEEAIRWTTPVKHFVRVATEDTQLRGRHIAKGDPLMLCYASANRDEEVFEDPMRFHVGRSPNKQLAFGYGGHVCLGQHLARMEMRILFEELLPHIKSIELDGAPTRTQACFVNGPKSLPIRFELN